MIQNRLIHLKQNILKNEIPKYHLNKFFMEKNYSRTKNT